MPQPIKKSDIVENDILQGLIAEFERANEINKQFNEELKKSAKLLKGGLGKVDFSSTESLTQANIRLKEANQLFKQKLELEKANRQNAIAEEKLKQQQIKTQDLLNKQTEREIKNQTKLQGSYSRINGWLRDLRKEYRDLAIRKEVLNNLSKDEERRMLTLEKRIGLYDIALKKVDASMGNHQRNVGNYASAWNGLGNSINQLTREMPAFANSMQTGFMAISNNLPMFFDEIQKIKKENNELISQGKPFKSLWSQIGSAIFSVGTALSVGVTLLTVYGAEIFKFIGNLSSENRELEKNKIRLQERNEELENSIDVLERIGKVTDNVRNKQIAYLRATLKDGQQEEAIYRYRLQQAIEYYDNLFKKATDSEEKTNNLRKQLNQETDEEERDRIKKEYQQSLKQTQDLVDEYRTRNITLRTIEEEGQRAIQKEREDNLKKQIDLERQIQDEQVKRINDKLQLDLQNVRIDAERRIEDLRLINADEKQKNRLIKEIKLTLTNEITKIYDEYYKTLEEQAKTYYEKEIELFKKAINEQESLKERQKKNQEEWDKDVLSKIEDYYTEKETIEINNTKNTNEELKKIELENNIQKLKDKLSYLNADKELHKSEIIKTENELAKLERDLLNKLEQEQLDLQKEYDEQEKKALKESHQFRRQIVTESANYFIQQSERRIEQLDKELARHQSNYSTLQELAKQGNVQAKESLAIENQQIVEANKKKMEEQKRMQRIKFAESAFTAYSNNAENGEKNPLLKTITDMTLLRQFIATLPAFEKGTEDTGKNGQGIDGKGGFLSILHPNERVMTKEQNAMLGGLKNDEVAEIIDMHRSGKLVQFEGANALNTNWQTSLLISEIKDLKQIIKDKPEMSIEAGKIIQGTMEIVETRKQGNTVRRNKYIV